MSATLKIERNAKALGAFYTPQTIADVLAHWIVRSGNERLLEPSIGEGALVKAALARAHEIAGTDRQVRFLACDIDAEALATVRPWLVSEHELHSIDFLELDPTGVHKVDGVIANPPFTRNHALEISRRNLLRQRFGVEGAAGLWVHFLVHACKFLAPNGRLAAVVPAAVVFTQYGRAALERICQQFATVEVRQIVDKPMWGNAADERGAIILADGYGVAACGDPVFSRWSSTGERLTDAYAGNSICFRESMMAAVTLNSVASLSIGAVTGCNQVFLLNEQERVLENIDENQLVSIAARARHIPGLRVSREDLRELATQHERTWLLAPKDIDRSREGVRRRLARISRDKRRKTVWLNKRKPWWAVDSGPDCDAIFTYMNDKGPRLVLAGPGVKCTNTLHRVLFRERVSHQDRCAAALTLVSTFGQLAAEQLGRTYGGGVLKFELTDARRLPVLLPGEEIAEPSLTFVDLALRSGKMGAARQAADQVLLPRIFGRSWRSAVEEMSRDLARLRADRHGRERT